MPERSSLRRRVGGGTEQFLLETHSVWLGRLQCRKHIQRNSEGNVYGCFYKTQAFFLHVSSFSVFCE